MLVQIAILMLGTVLLVLGAEAFTRGVAGLALRSGLGSYGVGLASTALGALVPALAVTLAAVAADRPELALGGLIGGSIAQLTLILGVCAVSTAMRARLKLFAGINPAIIGAAVLVWLLSLDADIGSVDGVVLVLAYVVVAVLIVRAARREDPVLRNELAAASGTDMLVWRDAARVMVGALMLPFAAVWLVQATLAISAACSVSPLVLGLTLLGGITALASVLPTVAAARRGQGDYAIGHALGAVLGNLLLLVGMLALWQPLAVAHSLHWIEIPALVVLAIAIYPMMRSDGELSRREGSILVAVYVLYLIGEAWMLHA